MKDDELDAEERAIVARLRSLPTEGQEPDWSKFGRELASKLDATPTRKWWQRWWAPAIGLGMAAATAAALLAWPSGAAVTPDAERVAVLEIDAAPAPVPVARTGDPVLAFGAEGELDDEDLDDDAIADEVMAALALEDDDEADALLDDVPDEPEDGLVPDLDLDWVEELDEEDLDLVEAWLDDEAG